MTGSVNRKVGSLCLWKLTLTIVKISKCAPNSEVLLCIHRPTEYTSDLDISEWYTNLWRISKDSIARPYYPFWCGFTVGPMYRSLLLEHARYSTWCINLARSEVTSALRFLKKGNQIEEDILKWMADLKGWVRTQCTKLTSEEPSERMLFSLACCDAKYGENGATDCPYIRILTSSI